MARTKRTQKLTEPITRDGDYFYDGNVGFYLKLEGNDHRYQRANPKELYSQVTCSSAEKDETVAYYTAQLKLYGLEPKRTRPAMKKVLLGAFGDGRTLEVPQTLRDLEEDLKEFWDADIEVSCMNRELGLDTMT